MQVSIKSFLPHLLVIAAGVACLAMIWRLEPPIRAAADERLTKTAPMSPVLGVALATDRQLAVARLTVRIGWDPKVLTAPRLAPAGRPGAWQPELRAADGMLTVTMTPARRGVSDATADAFALGPGRIVRLSFVSAVLGAPAGIDKLRIVQADGVDPSGKTVPIAGLRLVDVAKEPDCDETP